MYVGMANEFSYNGQLYPQVLWFGIVVQPTRLWDASYDLMSKPATEDPPPPSHICKQDRT
jgi:hypothetical protein